MYGLYCGVLVVKVLAVKRMESGCRSQNDRKAEKEGQDDHAARLS